jgi:hypothetical protein
MPEKGCWNSRGVLCTFNLDSDLWLRFALQDFDSHPNE